MGMIIFVIFAVLFLFGLPIVITLAVGKIASDIKEKKDSKQKAEKDKNPD